MSGAPTDWIMIAVGVAIIGFLWNLHRDMRSLSERVARLEGQVQVLASQMQTVMQTLMEREVRS